MNSWYYVKDGEWFGPVVGDGLKRLAAVGLVQPADLVWREGTKDWVAASKVKKLFTAQAEGTPTAPPTIPPLPNAPDEFAEPTFSEKPGRTKAKPRRRKLTMWAGAAGVMFIGLVMLIVYLTGGKNSNPMDGDSTGSKKSGSHGALVLTKDNSKSQSSLEPQPRKAPDFSKVDYSVDFSNVNYSPVDFTKLDYSKGPKGQAIQERKGTHPKEKDSPYWGKPYLERGYMGQDGEFVRHGFMTTWYLGGMSKTKERKFEEVQFYNGKRHGAFVALDKNGNKEDEGFAVEGKLHGRRTGFYPSGQKKTESYYVGGKQHGTSQAWHENGKLMAQGAFVNGQRHGQFLRWHPDGAKDDEEFYIDGKLHGSLAAWYPNGQKKVESVFVNGKQEARRLEWYENGQKSFEVVYIDGLAQGKHMQWHPNGKVYNEGHWKDGKEEGVWTRLHPNGRKQSVVEFVTGKRQGRLESWYENGQLDEVATFDQGKRNGQNTRYCPNGRLLFEYEYLNGQQHGLCVDYEGTGSGRVVKSVNYRNGLPN